MSAKKKSSRRSAVTISIAELSIVVGKSTLTHNGQQAFSPPPCVVKISNLIGIVNGASTTTYVNLVNEITPTFNMSGNNTLTINGSTTVPNGTAVLGTLTGPDNRFTFQNSAPSSGTKFTLNLATNIGTFQGTLPGSGTTVTGLLEISSTANGTTTTDSLVISLGF